MRGKDRLALAAAGFADAASVALTPDSALRDALRGHLVPSFASSRHAPEAYAVVRRIRKIIPLDPSLLCPCCGRPLPSVPDAAQGC